MKLISLLYTLLLLFQAVYLSSLDKPVLRTGTKAKSSFDVYNGEKLYASKITDRVYLGIYERFSRQVALSNTIEFEYVTYNKFENDISTLNALSVKNNLTLKVTLAKFHSLSFKVYPRISQNGKKLLYSQGSGIFYKLSLEHVKFSLSYSHRFAAEETSLFYHTLSSKAAWNIPGKKAVTYKIGFSLNFQHYYFPDESGGYPEQAKSVLKDAAVDFEVIINCNKVEVDSDIWEEEE